jgi:photoactive yellow protein
MPDINQIHFDQLGLIDVLMQSTDARLDELTFGVIGFDGEGVVRRYNTFESAISGLSPENVLGCPLFTDVTPCMNNFMVAQRFEDARELGTDLDDTIGYVLTLRMRPIRVSLRLLSTVAGPMRFILVQRVQ